MLLNLFYVSTVHLSDFHHTELVRCFTQCRLLPSIHDSVLLYYKISVTVTENSRECLFICYATIITTLVFWAFETAQSRKGLQMFQKNLSPGCSSKTSVTLYKTTLWHNAED
jgi:hypothetical protein